MKLTKLLLPLFLALACCGAPEGLDSPAVETKSAALCGQDGCQGQGGTDYAPNWVYAWSGGATIGTYSFGNGYTARDSTNGPTWNSVELDTNLVATRLGAVPLAPTLNGIAITTGSSNTTATINMTFTHITPNLVVNVDTGTTTVFAVAASNFAVTSYGTVSKSTAQYFCSAGQTQTKITASAQGTATFDHSIGAQSVTATWTAYSTCSTTQPPPPPPNCPTVGDFWVCWNYQVCSQNGQQITFKVLGSYNPCTMVCTPYSYYC